MSDRFDEHQRQTLEHLAALFAAPDADIAELDTVYLQIIADYLIQISAVGFQREGRGVVFVDIPEVARPDGHTALVPAYYLSQAKTRLSGLIWSDLTIVQAIETYNPRTEVLVSLTHAPKAGLYRIKRHERSARQRTSTIAPHPGSGVPAQSVRVSRISR